MTIDQLAAFLPLDRRRALSGREELPSEFIGSALLADISGFTPLTEALASVLGPRRGAEELSRLLDTVYTALVARVHHFGGSVASFIGDALVGVFPNDDGLRALACGLQMQRTMATFRSFPAPHGGRITLSMKASVSAGPMRRFVVGDPTIQRLDVLAGATVDRAGAVERVAERGEVVASPEVARRLRRHLFASSWRGRTAVVEGLRIHVEPDPVDMFTDGLTAERLRPFLLGPVVQRIEGGEGGYLSELRSIAVVFARFGGIDYDGDDSAGGHLDAYARWVQRIARDYGGHLLLITTADKGSHLYVVFGALEAHEDDEERAIATATQLVELPPELGFITQTQVGVARGRARVGAYGAETRRTYGAIGDAVNLAARLMEAAPPGEVRCCGGVAEGAGGRWTFERLAQLQLKGKAEPQPVYRPRAARRGERRLPPNRLVGRRSELDILEAALNEARAGTRRIVIIEGEAGIGKSCLAEELRRRAVDAGFVVLAGAADGLERHVPYRAWRRILAGALALDTEEPRENQRRRLLARLDRLGPSTQQRAPLLNDILDLGLPESRLTLGYDAQVRHESLAALVAALLFDAAGSRPLALFVEDTHWLDSSSAELAESVARSAVGRRVLLVVTRRPADELAGPGRAALGRLQGAETLSLGPLPAEETVRLAADRIGLAAERLPEQLVSLLAERAEGHPFFAVELIGALRDEGLLRVAGGVCTVVDDGSLRDRVPDTMEGVVLSRIDRLPVDEQLTLRVASVLGRSFRVRPLGDVHPARPGADELHGQLDHTCRRRLTVQEREEPEAEYAFHHVVTQRVAYETLLHAQRRRLHRDVARWYESAYADRLEPHLPLLVIHWQRAGHPEKELSYCKLAGEQAAARHADVEAEMYLSQAIERCDELDPADRVDRRVELLLWRARLRGLLGRVEGEREDLGRVERLLDRSADHERRNEWLLQCSDHERRCGRFDDAERRAEQALAAAAGPEAATRRARALVHIGHALEGAGRYTEAVPFVERALASFQNAERRGGEASCLKLLGVISARLGELPTAMERFEAAQKLVAVLGDRKAEADLLGNLGALSYYLGDYERCIEHTRRAESLFDEMGNRIGSAKCLTNLGNSYTALGAYAEGLQAHRQALDLYRQMEDASGSADSLCNVGLAHAALGVGGQPGLTCVVHRRGEALAAAIETTKEALRLYVEIGSRRGEMLCRFNLGVVLLCLGEGEAAEGELEEALRLSRAMEHHASVRWTASTMARAALLRDDIALAVARSGDAMVGLGDETPPESIEMHFTHHRVLAAAGRQRDAAWHLERARELARQEASRIRDASLRERFVATHHELLER